VLTVVAEAFGRTDPTVYPAADPTLVIERTSPVVALTVPASSMPGETNREVTWSCRHLPARAVRARVSEVLLRALESWTAPRAVVEDDAILTTGVVPEVTAIGAVPVTAVTGAVPEEAAVRRP
jgi:hypothetical protein